jgi:hypothetical protein
MVAKIMVAGELILERWGWSWRMLIRNASLIFSCSSSLLASVLKHVCVYVDLVDRIITRGQVRGSKGEGVQGSVKHLGWYEMI